MTNATCPPREELADYLVGKIAEPQLLAIGAHVAECPPCQTLLDTLHEIGGDTLVSQLRQPPAEESPSDQRDCQEALEQVAELAVSSFGTLLAAVEEPAVLD